MAQQSAPTTRRGRLWQGLKSFAVVASAVSAAAAAIYSRDIACSINHAESSRLAYEPLRFTHEAYRDYLKYRASDIQTKRPRLRCFDFLISDAVTKDELRLLLGFYPGFKYDGARHSPLGELCFDRSERAEWSESQAELLNIKLGREIAMLDATLIAFKHPIGNRVLVCENFAGFLQAGIRAKQYEYGILGRFLERAIEIGAVRDDNYGNLKYFTERLASKTDHFKKEADCEVFKEVLVADPCEWMVVRWYRGIADRTLEFGRSFGLRL